MGNKIYVGNLPFSMTLEDLKKEFEKFGEIEEAIVIANKFTGRSKGFGFVTFKDEASAEKAIKEMDGKEVGGRQLKVNEARPMRDVGTQSETEAPKSEETDEESEEKKEE